jgi:hypothetical protein
MEHGAHISHPQLSPKLKELEQLPSVHKTAQFTKKPTWALSQASRKSKNAQEAATLA